jgi:hypothetical protein
MVQILNFDDAMHARAATARRQSGRPNGNKTQTVQATLEDTFSYWPEVSSGLWVSKGPVLPDPRNSPGRVFTEVFLVLGGAGLLVLLTTVFLGAPQ